MNPLWCSRILTLKLGLRFTFVKITWFIVFLLRLKTKFWIFRDFIWSSFQVHHFFNYHNFVPSTRVLFYLIFLFKFIIFLNSAILFLLLGLNFIWSSFSNSSFFLISIILLLPLGLAFILYSFSSPSFF